MLNCISFGINSHNASNPIIVPWTFNTESSLRSLTLGQGSNWRRQDIGVEWSTLETFVFVGDEAVGLTFMLEMINLRSALVSFEQSDDSVENPFVRLPTLRNLVIGDDDHPEPIFGICPITSLETPALQCLHIHLEPDSTHLPLLTTMLLRSQCPLVDLVLNDLNASMGNLVELLQVVPSLRTFSFNLVGESVLTDEFVDAMNPPEVQTSTHGRCLPHISKITYTGRISFKPLQIIDMLKSRSGTSLNDQIPADKQLKDFTILCKNPDWASAAKPNIMRRFYQEIWALKSLGTTFDITYEEVVTSESDRES
ncbi:hypothetical protein CPB83DRAFT_899955 [Crepidotus variabilis]|uniref:Uncharacterized protein n=1 Tax=Crepidotus variabilis TaxID=179855 RepID=A0A9P6E412_9AGAR|nr:hypothetical protein CPB83DRAFT_899955 [Crepidotus variabilis]